MGLGLPNKNLYIFLLILLLGLTLRIYQLDRFDLWYDESIAAVDARPLFSLPALNRLLDKDFVIKFNQDYLAFYNHCFVYYWQKISGSSEFGLRLSSAAGGALAICLSYLISRSLFNLKTALISSFLLAVSPLHIYYSQELTPYIFIPPLALLAFYSLLKAQTTNRMSYWFFYIISITLSIYFRYTTLLLLFSFLIFVVVKVRRSRKILAFGLSTHAVIFVLIIPCLLTIFPLVNYMLNYKISPACSEFPCWVDKITWRNLLFTVKNFSIGYSMNFYSFFGITSTALYALFFSLGLYKKLHRYENQLLLFSFVFPITALFLISQIKPCYVDRYLFFTLPFFLMGAGAGLARLNRVFLYALLLMISLLSFAGLKNYYSDVLPQDYNQHIGVVERLEGINNLAQFIAGEFKKGDRILHLCKKSIFPLKFYIGRDYTNPDLIREVNRGRVVYVEDKTDLISIDYKSTHPRLADIEGRKKLKIGSRTWLILSSFASRRAGKETLPEWAVIDLINNDYSLKHYKDFGDIRLYLIKNE